MKLRTNLCYPNMANSNNQVKNYSICINNSDVNKLMLNDVKWGNRSTYIANKPPIDGLTMPKQQISRKTKSIIAS